MMKNKTITYILVGIVLLFFTGYFSLKEVVRKDLNITERVEQVEHYAKQDEWEKAYSLAKEIQNDWKKYSVVININYAESEHALFEEFINMLMAGSEAKDLPTVLSNARNAKGFWINLNKIVPGP